MYSYLSFKVGFRVRQFGSPPLVSKVNNYQVRSSHVASISLLPKHGIRDRFSPYVLFNTPWHQRRATPPRLDYYTATGENLSLCREHP